MTKPQTAMSNTKPTTKELARSWVVAWDKGRPVLVPSAWVVGYTADYKSTPSEAIEYEMNRVREDMLDQMEMVNDLELLLLNNRPLIEEVEKKDDLDDTE